ALKPPTDHRNNGVAGTRVDAPADDRRRPVGTAAAQPASGSDSQGGSNATVSQKFKSSTDEFHRIRNISHKSAPMMSSKTARIRAVLLPLGRLKWAELFSGIHA